MSQPDHRTLGVATIGINNRQDGMLRHFFQEHCHGDYVLISEETAELLLIDIDQPVGSKRFSQFILSETNPAMILLSLNHGNEGDDEERGIYRVTKPLKVDILTGVLNHARHHILQRTLQQTPVHLAASAQPVETTVHHAAEVNDIQEAHAYIGSAPDIDPSNSSQYEKAFHDPNHYLVGQLRQALATVAQQRQPYLLESNRGSLLLPPQGRLIASTISGAQLRTLATFPDVQLSLRPLERGELFAEGATIEQFDRDSLLWRTALWGARGRLPDGTDLETPIYLKHWPNFTRLQLFPHALQIAALWRRQPHTLLESAQRLGIAQRYVFALYSATNALGLAGLCRRDSDSMFEREHIPEHSLRGLFGRLVSHLRNETEQLKERA